MSVTLPPVSRIKREDVPNADRWLDDLLVPLNKTLDFLYTAFNGGISLAGNVAGLVKELEVRTAANYTSGEFETIRFKTGLPAGAISAVSVLQVIDLDSPDAVLSGAYSADWRASSGEVLVRRISGLRASHRYWIRFHVW